MNLLFLNALKGLRKKKVQMLGIILCIILSTSIYTAMNCALDRMNDRYHNYLKEQNVEDFAFSPNIDFSKDYTKAEIEELKNNELKDLPVDQMQIINQYQMTIGMKNIPNSDRLHMAVSMILNNSGATKKKAEEKIQPLLEKYDFSYYTEESKLLKENKKQTKALIYNKDAKVNIPYLVEGNFPQNSGEITILPSFAKENDIHINDMYKIGDKEYKVTGFSYAPNYILPLVSMNSPIFSAKNDNIVYMENSDYQDFSGMKEVSYIGAFNDKDKILDFKALFDLFSKEDGISLSNDAAMRIARVNALELEVQTDRLFAKYFLYLLLGISVFVIFVITKKRIEDERLQIGVLKALGYRSTPIACSYLVYPIVGSIIGGIIGFATGAFASNLLSKVYLSYFNMPIDGYSFNLEYLAQSILVPLVLLSVLAFIIAIIMLRKKPLKLLKEGSNLKVNWFSRLVSFITRKFPFKSRFRYSLASRSFGKLFIVTLTSFCTGLLVVLVLIGMNMFSSMLDTTFDAFDFNQEVGYYSTQYGTNNTDDDLGYNATMILEKVEKPNGDIVDVERKDEKDKKKDYTVSLVGLDSDVSSLKIKDKNNENLMPKIINDDEVVVNQNISQIAKIETGDILILKSGDKEYRYKVVGLDSGFMASNIYMKRSALSKLMDGREDGYNLRYTKDPKYSDTSKIDKEELGKIATILSVEDLERNMKDQMSSSNGAIYFVIFFASIMAFVIILIIANIVVEENKKTISLMKVMGYNSKTVGSVVLNIYTPFIIIAYILAIPVMKSILRAIVSSLMKNMDFALPIEFSLVKAIIGLGGILVAYYVAIFISKRSLNKVPLSVALKRE